MVQPVTDPVILAKLNEPDKPVTNPKILAQLNAPSSIASSAGNTTLEGISSSIESGPLGKAERFLEKATDSSAYKSLMNAMPLPSADPVADTYNTAQQILQFPDNLHLSLGSLSGPVSEIAATHLGAMGLEPHISAALAMAVGMVTDPRNLAMFGKSGVPNLKGKNFPKFGNIGGEATIARATQAERMGVNLSPAEASQTKLLNVVEDLANIYPYTGDDFANFYKSRLEQADTIRASLVDKVGNNEATKQVAQMMKTQIQEYLKKATPEQASYLQDKFGDLDAYMKKPAAGQFTQSMLAQNRKLSLDAAGAQFEDLRKIVPEETPINTSSFQERAKEFLKQELQGKKSDQNPGWVKRLKEYAGITEADVPMMDGEPVTGPLAEAIKKAMGSTAKSSEATMPFGATQMTMRKLRDLRIAHDPGYLSGIKGQGDTYAGYAAELRKTLHNDIEGGLNTLSDQAKEALKASPPTDPAIASHVKRMTSVAEMYKSAKVNYAQTKELMNDPFVIKLLKNDPEDFLDHAVKAQDITNIAKLKEILGPDNFVPVKQNLLANMLVDKEGVINPQSFVRKIDKIGFPSLTKVFEPDEIYQIAQTQDVFSNMKRGFVEGSQTGGRLMAKAALFGIPAQAYHQVMSGQYLKAVGTLVAGTGIPKALAKMYLSKTGRDILIHGISVPDSAATALSLLSKGAMMSGLENTRASAEPAATQ